MSTAWPADPFRILLVVDDDEVARGVAAALGPEFAGGLRTCMKPDQVKAQARSHRAQTIVLALESLDAVERVAQTLQGDAGARPVLIALCDSAGTTRCYTFAMVTPPPFATRSLDRGAWPWRRCPSLARR